MIRMLIDLLFLAIFIAFSIFMLNRLYVGLRNGRLNVRGVLYSRKVTPIQFWLTVLFGSIAFLVGIVMVLADVANLAP